MVVPAEKEYPMTKYAENMMVDQVKARIRAVDTVTITGIASTGRKVDLSYSRNKERELFMARKPRALLVVKAGR